MLLPYFLMALLYLFVALMAVIDASLISLDFLPFFQGIRWFRIHFITLGMMTETLFGVLPVLAAARMKQERPAMRWDIWLGLNAGLVVLAAGIASMNATLIITGGTLIFVTTILLGIQLWQMAKSSGSSSHGSVKFYVSGLSYFLVGILIGTGYWFGWSDPLRIQIPLEAHIHANNWGFLSLVFAGVLISIIPPITGRSPIASRTNNAIFWSMTLGALGLVLGPWLGGALIVTVPGLILHIGATLTLLVIVVRALSQSGGFRQPGAWHIVTAYFWILLPVMVAPLIILGVPGIPGAVIEATAPQALIYGWVLQFAYAVIPYFARRFISAQGDAELGGCWLSLLAANVGSVFIWLSIFLVQWTVALQGFGYALYALSMLPIAVQLLKMLGNWAYVEEPGAPAYADD